VDRIGREKANAKWEGEWEKVGKERAAERGIRGGEGDERGVGDDGLRVR